MLSRNDFDFDTRIDRRGSSSFKWDSDERDTGRRNLLPFWVADMDFAAPPPVLQALERRLDHGVFGYTARPESLDEAMIGWFARRHDWTIDSAAAFEVPGVVPFIHMYVRELVPAGEAVVIQEPVYYPFRRAMERNGRKVAVNPLVRDTSGRWRMDLDGLDGLLEAGGASTLILCSPHNPVGRVWSRPELLELADLCRRRGVTVLSDEIHADLIHPGHRHIPWLSLPADRLPRSVALVSPTKTFNIPGLSVAYGITPDTALRRRLTDMIESMGMGIGSSAPLAFAAAEAAWRHGDAWLESLLDYLGENDRLLRRTLADRGAPLSAAPMEGTYLEWLRVDGSGEDDEALWDRLLDRGIRLSRGRQFGRGGEAHLRMNIACPRSQLVEGLERMIPALEVR